ncbi:MAG: bifunctional 2-polyprenyl-6-hydroxyphenol methylase/3-demethylubiquinol 3-O-methyltransferase UbiG [Gammaproteobacteria bacterium]|nr:bifunctional 2-polyprenyl-6-hydroxyphenol methylase/3-demethylubiquinol 3-O-methyltransferase UbiG [Gammaproteobacteria bacterium]MBI5617643.1 bifunctional 2-polyprenyl-6-hydroxyphenol methylase/3-demethylubiquinol 3-O-methyltransferase UbiG [Gammaproteobacteria bacterium]
MLNLDETEIAKFRDLAAAWWDERGASRTLHDINPARTQFVAARCDLKGTRVLDVGCGGGIFSEALAREGAVVTGIDAGVEVIRIATGHAHESGLAIDYCAVTAEEFARERAGEFAVVTCMELLEHVPDPESLLVACHELLAPGGQLFVSTLNRTAAAWLGAVVGAEYLAGLLPRGTHDYSKFIRPAELARWLRGCGFEVREIAGMQYNPLTRGARIGGSTRVNYLLHAVRPA